jgi:hypothetical protein
MGRPEWIADQPVETGRGDHQEQGLNDALVQEAFSQLNIERRPLPTSSIL